MQSSGIQAGLSAVQVRDVMGALLGNTVRVDEVLGPHGAEYLLRAHDHQSGVEVFVRVFASDPAAFPEAYASFERRAQTAAALDHPNIIAAHPMQRCERISYYMVPASSGSTLDSSLTSEKPLSLERAIRMLREIASAIDYAHENGVVHGQLEPSSIQVKPSDAVVVTGFGIGPDISISRSGRSLAYLAPECWHSHAVIDGSADIYALGVIAFEMMAHRRRAMSRGAEGIAMVDSLPVTHDAPLRPEIGLQVNKALLRAVAKHPSARFPTARALVEALEGRANTPPTAQVTQRPTLDVPRSPHFAVVPMLLVTAVGIVAGVLASPAVQRVILDTGHFSTMMDEVDMRSNLAFWPEFFSSSPTGSWWSAPVGSLSPPSPQSIFARGPTGGGDWSDPYVKPFPLAPGVTAVRAAPEPWLTVDPRSIWSVRSPMSSATAEPTFEAANDAMSDSMTDAPDSSDSAGASSNPVSVDSSGFVRVDVEGGSGVVTVDGVPRGRSPFLGKLRSGRHAISVVSAAEVHPKVLEIIVAPGDTIIGTFYVATPPLQ